MKRIFVVCGAAVSLAGCLNVGMPLWPWKDNPNPCKPQDTSGLTIEQVAAINAKTDCNGMDAITAYATALQYCRDVQGQYDRTSNKYSNASYYLSSAGALAGAVVSPVAKGSAVTAWSGFSGATNAARTSFEDAFAGSVAIARSARISGAVKQGATNYEKAPSERDKVRVSMEMALACQLSAADADKDIIKNTLADIKGDDQDKPADTTKKPTDKPADKTADTTKNGDGKAGEKK